MKNPILVTGAAGFIGYHLSKKLVENDFKVVGIDNLNSYYDTQLKKDRLFQLERINNSNKFIFLKGDLIDNRFIEKVFEIYKPRIVINLAAQAGVRFSLEDPNSYIKSNIVGFGNLIENCKINKIEHLIYASSSSVYGGNKVFPFSEHHGVDHPVSIYAATKRSNELIAHTYSHLYNLPTTGLRFFTVYGPWGRPDMGYFIFTSKISKNQPIKVFNNGNMIRDFTYIDDVVDCIYNLLSKKPLKNDKFDYYNPSISKSWAPYRIFNLGNSSPINLQSFIELIEKNLNKKAKKEFLPMQLGDVENTSADISQLKEWVGFRPKTTIQVGIKKFIDWYIGYYV